MAKRKYLIVPGMAKSGTTFMWDQFVNRTDRVNFGPRKEIGYFAVGHDLDKHDAFFSTHDDSKIYLDATPEYSDLYKEFASNAKIALKDAEVQIIFCLRDPIARAFSHYRHDLSTHFWTCSMGDYSFYSEGALRRYVRPYLDIINTFQNAFGAENVHGYSFKQTKDTLPAKVLKFMGLPKNWKLDLNINPAPGGGLPRVVYDKRKDTYIEQDGNIYRLPAKTLLVCTSLHRHLRHNYPEDLGERIVGHSSNWTKNLDYSKFGKTWAAIQKDYNASLEALGMDSEKLEQSKSIPYKEEMPLPDSILERLEKVDSVENISKNIYQEALNGAPWVSGNEHIADDQICLAGQIEKIQRVFKAQKNLPERIHELKRTVDNFGPIREHLTSYLVIQLNLGNLDEVIRVLENQPHAGSLINKDQINAIIARKGSSLNELDVNRIKKLAQLG